MGRPLKVKVEAEKLYTKNEELIQADISDMFDESDASATSFTAKTGEKMEHLEYTGEMYRSYSYTIQELANEIKAELESQLEHKDGLSVIVSWIDLETYQEEAKA